MLPALLLLRLSYINASMYYPVVCVVDLYLSIVVLENGRMILTEISEISYIRKTFSNSLVL